MPETVHSPDLEAGRVGLQKARLPTLCQQELDNMVYLIPTYTDDRPLNRFTGPS